MPLITNTLPARENVEPFQDSSLHVQHKEEVREQKDKDNGYDDFQEFDDECVDSDMEGSILHRPRPKKRVQPPALPARSDKRASKILESVMKELQSLDGTENKDDSVSMLQESDPHELYLSSEEDASLSDDYEDSDSLVDDEEESEVAESRESTSRSSRRKSQEDTARVVSFMVVGKPQIVDIYIPSNHTSPVDLIPSRHSMNLDALSSLTKAPSAIKTSPSKPTSRRPAPLKLYPSSMRRMSISSTLSSYTNSSNHSGPTNASMTNLSTISSSHSGGTTNLPPRKSSRLALNMASIVTSLSNKSSKNTNSLSASTFSASSTHSFLDSDPYAQHATHNLPVSPTETSTPLTPKTPTSAAQWAKGLGRSLTRARKPSMPKLSLAYSNSSSNSNSNLSAPVTNPGASTSYSNRSSSLARITSNPEPPTPKEFDEKRRQSIFGLEDTGVKRSETAPVVQSPKDAPVRYEDIMKSVIRAPPPIPLSVSAKDGRKSFSLGLGRKKSVKR